jgi:hypothetical protein
VGEENVSFSVDQITLYATQLTSHPSPEMPTRKTVIELAEGKIGFFGYRNRTKPVSRVSEAFSVAVFCPILRENSNCAAAFPPPLPFSTFGIPHARDFFGAGRMRDWT